MTDRCTAMHPSGVKCWREYGHTRDHHGPGNLWWSWGESVRDFPELRVAVERLLQRGEVTPDSVVALVQPHVDAGLRKRRATAAAAARDAEALFEDIRKGFEGP